MLRVNPEDYVPETRPAVYVRLSDALAFLESKPALGNFNASDSAAEAVALLSGRKGFSAWWDCIGEDNQEEILEAITKLWQK